MIDAMGRISDDLPASRDPILVAHRPYGMRRTLLGFSRLADGSHLVLERRLSVVPGRVLPLDSGFLTRVFEADSSELLATWIGSTVTAPYGSILDVPSLIVSGDTAHLAGNTPPRVIDLPVLGTGKGAVRPLRGLQPMPMSDQDRGRLTAELGRRGVGSADVQAITAYYPAIVSARPVAGEVFVVGVTGPDRYSLSAVCRSGSARVLLKGGDIARIFLLSGHVVVVRDQLPQNRMLLEASPYTEFETGCPT
jgi:hypothetical protein